MITVVHNYNSLSITCQQHVGNIVDVYNIFDYLLVLYIYISFIRESIITFSHEIVTMRFSTYEVIPRISR